MKISGLNESRINYLSGEELKNKYFKDMSSVFESIDINTSSLSNLNISNKVIKNKESEFLVSTLIQVYDKNLVGDLTPESLEKLKKSELIIRNISPESKSETWITKLLEKTLNFTSKHPSLETISNFINGELIINDIYKKTGSYYSQSDSNIDRLNDVRSTEKQKQKPNHILVSANLESKKYGSLISLTDSGLTDKEVLNYVFLHELSHSIQYLQQNEESLVSASNSDEISDRGVVTYQADRQFLGSPNYMNNKIYTNMLESYADLRSIITFGLLNPDRFNIMLDSIISWRNQTDKLEGHNTVEALKLLKEKYPDGLKLEMTADEIHSTSRNLATINILAKQEYIMKKTSDEIDDLFDIPSSESVYIDNNIAFLSLKDKGYNKDQHLKKVIELKEYVSNIEGVSNMSYPVANYCTITGHKLLRDRSGFLITDKDIINAKIEHILSNNPESGTVEKLNKRIIKDYANMFKNVGQLPPFDKISEVLDVVREENKKSEKINKIPTEPLRGIFSHQTIQEIENYVAKNYNESLKDKNKVISLINEDLNILINEPVNKKIETTLSSSINNIRNLRDNTFNSAATNKLSLT